MIIVTEQAKNFFCGVHHPEDKVVRLDLAENNAPSGRPGEKQVRMVAGEPRKDDQVVRCGGKEVLYISRAVSEAFDGCVLKPLEIPEGVGFSIAPPRPAETPPPEGCYWRTRHESRSE